MRASYGTMLLGAVLWCGSPVRVAFGAQGGNAGQDTGPKVNSLKIFVLQGEDAVNSIPNRTITMPVVEVRDENDQPIEGAEVVFELPAVGPSGFFPGQQLVKKLTTNLQGQAGAEFRPNGEPGRFRIKVTATSGDRVGRAVITQENSMKVQEAGVAQRSRLGKWVILAAIVGGGAAAAAIVTTRGGSGSGAPTLTLTPGIPVFGNPR